MKDTRNKLLQTALKLFSQRGLNGVSTRDLAKESGVNLCSINYYFGSKQKLYDAVIDTVVDHFKDVYVNKVQEELKHINSPREEIKCLISVLFDVICSGEISDTEGILLLKEVISPTQAYDKFYKEVFEPMHARVSDALKKMFAVTESAAIIQAHILFGQVILFRLGRIGLLRRLQKNAYTSELLAEIKENLLGACDTILNAMEV